MDHMVPIGQHAKEYALYSPCIGQHSTRKYGSHGPYMVQHSRELSKNGKSKMSSKHRYFSNGHIYNFDASKNVNLAQIRIY